MKKSKARMSQRIREGRAVSVFTRLCRGICPSGCRCRIIQTPGSRHYLQYPGQVRQRPDCICPKHENWLKTLIAEEHNLYLDVGSLGGTTPTFFIAIPAGLLSFLSPCVLPLVPA